MTHFVLASVVNHRLRILNDFRSGFPRLCFLSSQRCYGVTPWSKCNLSHHSCRSINTYTTTRLKVLPSATQHLQISRCTLHSDAVTDDRNVSTEQSTDGDCLGSQGSSLHTPVLAKEVVNLIAPVKGQVRVSL